MKASDIRETLLRDYRPPEFLIESIDLTFELDPEVTRIRSSMRVRRNPKALGRMRDDLILLGEDMKVESVVLDGELLDENNYRQGEKNLRVFNVPESFALEVVNRINPQANTALEGMYISGGNFCTQCEAHGFRKITFFLDRPDVLSCYRVLIKADKQRYPVLLSNGNLVASGDDEYGRHWVQWEDPFPKPCYLFALVAGNLVCIEDKFTTASGRSVLLQIYVEAHNRDKCAHAMHSLKKAMRWDEERFDREYDLERYMIVAVDDFNMGAMENKGLNIFNSKYVLADTNTATDMDYQNIESVIAHEYFHNWTGNRITCRDWFQLSLKEGLTVFRDQEFSADMGLRAVKRIRDVRRLRTVQFAEDAGPTAHSVQPLRYLEVSNFYTSTVYEKGAELVRMQHTIVGEPGFRKGMNLYFERHDGRAAMINDLVQAIEDTNLVDLRQFRAWYRQVGTPRLHVSDAYDPGEQRYVLSITQSYPRMAGSGDTSPLHIPFIFGLLDAHGHTLDFELDNGVRSKQGALLLHLRQRDETIVVDKMPSKPVPSLMRGFCAPVIVEYDYSDEDLMLLLAHDSDSFNRWDAGQTLALRIMRQLLDDHVAQRTLQLPSAYVDAMDTVLQDRRQPPALLAETLLLPSEQELAERVASIDVEAIHIVREFMLTELAKQLRDRWLETYNEFSDSNAYSSDVPAAGRRDLKNLALAYLMQLDNVDMIGLAVSQYRDSDNMTDCMAALRLLANLQGNMREDILQDFYTRWRHEPLVVNKWLTVQALSKAPDTLAGVEKLVQHEAFSSKNPNKVYALLGAFALSNQLRFHAENGAAYRLLTDNILAIDRNNPQVAARLVAAFGKWRRMRPPRRNLMQNELQRMVAAELVSPDVFELAGKMLEKPPEPRVKKTQSSLWK